MNAIRRCSEHLRSHSLKAALFVTGRFADNEKGKTLLREWDRAGHMIGNHSYSHKELNNGKVTTEVFTADILKAEAVLKDSSALSEEISFSFFEGRRNGHQARCGENVSETAWLHEWARHYRCFRLGRGKSSQRATDERSRCGRETVSRFLFEPHVGACHVLR